MSLSAVLVVKFLFFFCLHTSNLKGFHNMATYRSEFEPLVVTKLSDLTRMSPEPCVVRICKNLLVRCECSEERTLEIVRKPPGHEDEI